MGERLVGIDVGGTKVAVGVLEGNALRDERVEPTELSSEGALLAQLERIIRQAGAADAVGVAVPSVVDFATGSIRSSVNIPLADVPLREVLRERLGVPVFVDNDATCAGLAEAYDDERRILAHHLVILTVGTGVGGGVVIDGRVFRGATGAAPELGHIIVGADLADGAPEASDRFPQPGSLETLASGRALDRLARERGFASGQDAVERAEGGDGDARRVVGDLAPDRPHPGLGAAPPAVEALQHEVAARLQAHVTEGPGADRCGARVELLVARNCSPSPAS